MAVVLKQANILLYLTYLPIILSFNPRSNNTTTTTTTARPPLHNFSLAPKPTTWMSKACPLDKQECVQPIQCPAHVSKHAHDLASFRQSNNFQPCKLGSEIYGICCSSGYNHSMTDAPTSALRGKNVNGHRHFQTPQEMLNMHRAAHDEFMAFKRMEDAMEGRITRGHPEFTHNMVFRSTRPLDGLRSIKAMHQAFEGLIVSRLFKKIEQIPTEDFEYDHLDTRFAHNMCESSSAPCRNPALKYRTIDGSCNNVLNPSWGTAGYAMQRLLPPAYEDGIWAPRMMSVRGRPLSSARDISANLVEDVDRPHKHLNLMVMQFGQMIAHDITQSASITLPNGDVISCCTADGSDILPQHQLHYACLPIKVSRNDPFYSRFHQKCTSFVRSSLVPHDECKIGYARQLSKVTHFLDASCIYGFDPNTLSQLRSHQNGQLSMFTDFGRPLLPLAEANCLTMEKGSACFASGDGRTNQIIPLTALHILLAREHNRIAEILSHLNRHWNDETLFHEAQRILIAQYQVIIFKEWLPLIIGGDAMDRFNLRLKSGKYSQDYHPHVNPSVTNEFSTAAFRFGHSTVDGKLHVERDGKIDEIISLPEVMFNPARLRQVHFYDAIIKTLLTQPMQKVDNSITHGMSRYMFRNGNPFGLDIASINIQRGRDHAIRPYNDYVEASGRPRILRFEDVAPAWADKLAQNYVDVDDLDLWIGGLLEQAVPDGVVGQTFAEIIADQFSRFRRGDRYFHEHGPRTNPGAFTPQQLDEIRKITLARIICDNSDRIEQTWILPHAFLQPGPGNERTSCEDGVKIPIINFSAWRE